MGSRRESSAQPWLKTAFYVYLICWVLLCLYGIAWHRPRLVFAGDSWLLRIMFVLLFAPWLLLVMKGAREKAWRVSRAEARFGSKGSLFGAPPEAQWQMTGSMLAGLAGLLLVTYLAVFDGLARLLHYTDRKPGQVTVTVESKHTDSSRQARCIPRLGFKEFRLMSDQVCVKSKFFRSVKIGDKIRITGEVSSYAVEPDDLEIVNEASGQAGDVE